MANSKFIVKHGLKVGPFEVDAATGNITTTGTLSVNGSAPITAASTDTLTNKSIDLTDNTLSGTVAEFNAALSDGDFATLAGTETLTNKTIAAGSNTISGLTNANLSGSAGISNANLANSSVTINSNSLSLGGSLTLDTDDIGEGTNQYFTVARAESAARGAISASDAGGLGSFSYNSSTGAFTYTGPSDSDVRGLFSASDAGGDGSFSYNSSTGVFTYTGPSASEVRAHFSAGTGVTITSGQIAIAQSVATSATPTFAGLTLTGSLGMTGDILPSADNTYSLGSATYMWKDVYVGPGSLYVNGQKVLEENSGNIVVSCDINQNLVLQTSGSGDVELDPTGTGVIAVKGPLQISAGSNISSSDGNAINFSNQIAVDALTSKSSNTDLTLTGNGTGKVYINDNAEVSGNVVVQGNLTVQGTTTTVNSETISLADNIIDLNSNFTTGAPTENAGLRVMRGDEAATQLRWNETSDIWDFSNDGSTYAAIVGTSLTQTLTNKTIAAGSNTISGLTNSNLSGSAGITNANLANSKVTVGSTDISLGATATTLAGLSSVTSTSFVGALTGNADTATSAGKWTTSRTITLGGDLSGSVSIDGSANVTLTATVAANSVALGTDTTGNYMADVSAGTGIAVSHTAGEGSTATVSLSHLGIQSLTDPNADRILFWDDSAGAAAWLEVSTGLSLSGTALTNSGVTSITGTSNQVTASASTGGVTLSLPQNIHTSATPTFSGLTISSITKAGSNGTGDIGQTGNRFGTVWATTFSGTSTTAQYADLAEKYSADAEYEPGTVLCFGGDAEVTECVADMCRKVAGVVTTAPAHLMNAELGGVAAAIALQGRVPCKVVGPVAKGDMMVAAGNGRARAEANPVMGSVIGKALENFEGGEGVIEVAVGRL